MRLQGSGYLALFLGGLVGVAIGLVLLLIDRNTFPVISEGMYTGIVKYKNKEDRLIVQVRSIDVDGVGGKEVTVSTLGKMSDKPYTQKLFPNHSRFALGISYLPVQIPLQQEGKQQAVSFVGQEVTAGKRYEGTIIDSNRNTVGEWELFFVSTSASSTPSEFVRSAAAILHAQKAVDHHYFTVKSLDEQLDKDLARANVLLQNVTTLAAEGSEKLKAAKIAREQASQALKESQAVVDKLSDRILVTQRISPQSRLYELSRESLRIERKWFFSKLINEKQATQK